MTIRLGNLRTFTALGDKEKMAELQEKLEAMGYRNEDNCEENTNTDNMTWHIYDMPKFIEFSVLTGKATEILKEYSDFFSGRVAVGANKVVD